VEGGLLSEMSSEKSKMNIMNKIMIVEDGKIISLAPEL